MTNKVWLEIEHPANDDHEVGEKRAALFNNMIRRLCEPTTSDQIRWDRERKRYVWELGGGCYAVADRTDVGKWFNLDYYGR